MRNSILYLTIFGLAVPFFLYAQPGAPATPVPPAPPSAQHHILIPLGATSYLGVGVAEIDNDRARALNLKEAYGVEITHVDQDSPAEKAGLKAGDVVLEYNGQRVEGIEEFQRLVRETPAGRTVRLLIGRGGSTQTLLASIGNRRS